MKKGFGLLEVMIAAVVLGFLIIGLNKLQMGNREGVLRVRARDAASFIAHHVLDSLGAVGIYSIQKKPQDECPKEEYDGKESLVYCEKNYTYNFEGNSGGGTGGSNISAPIDYEVAVELLSEEQKTEETNLTRLESPSSLNNTYAKSLQATVKWKYRDSKQSIQVAKVVR